MEDAGVSPFCWEEFRDQAQRVSLVGSWSCNIRENKN